MKRRHDDEQDSYTSNVDLQQSIFRLGDQTRHSSTLEEEIKRVSGLIFDCLSDNEGSSLLENSLLETIVGSALLLPHKTSVYAMLVGLLAHKHPRFASLAVDLACQELFSSAEDLTSALMGQFARWMIELANCRVVDRAVVLALLDRLAARSDAFKEHVAMSIPWLYQQDAEVQSRMQAFGIKPLQRRESMPFLAFDDTLDALQPIDDLPVDVDRILALPVHTFQPVLDILPASNDTGVPAEQSYRWIEVIFSGLALNHRKASEYLIHAIPDERLLVNFLFTRLLRPSHSTVGIGGEVMLVAGCRISRSFAPAMAKAFRALIARPADFNVDFIGATRLAEWFAFHLSQFDFKWSWDEWEPYTCLGSGNVQRYFLSILLDRLHRLSYVEKIEAVVPAAFRTAFPVTSSVLERTTWDCATDEHADHLLALLRSKATDSIQEMLQTDQITLHMLIHAMLFLACKTLSHTMAILDRNAELLRTLASKGKDEKKKITRAVLDYFGGELGEACELVLAKLLLHLRVIDATSLLDAMLDNLSGDFRVSSVSWRLVRLASSVDLEGVLRMLLAKQNAEKHSIVAAMLHALVRCSQTLSSIDDEQLRADLAQLIAA